MGRFVVAAWLALQLGYTPIHLALEPHLSGVVPGIGTVCERELNLAESGHDGGHHERHPAAQHKVEVAKVTRSQTPVALMVLPLLALDLPDQSSASLAVGSSGLSPPELVCSWQFLFRAVQPARAPSSFS